VGVRSPVLRPTRVKERRPVSKIVEEERLPLVEERLRVDRRWTESGRVRIRTVTEDVPELLREELAAEAVEVRRVAVDRPLDGPADIRTEGDVTVIPVVEERLVVEKRLFVVEEIHVRRVVRRETVEEEFVLRRQRADVERRSSSGESREE
jgi:stress response protein YsnF